ncbi:MAG: hypothetical protein AB7F59_01000 [Bdellovibrionales bacterium]
MSQRENTSSMKAWDWKESLLVLLLLSAVIGVGVWTDYSDRFWVLGTIFTVFFCREGLNKSFTFFYFLGLALCFVSLRVDLFYALVLVAMAEALMLVWCFYRIDWTKEVPAEDTSLLLPTIITLALFFSYYLRTENKILSDYLIISYFFVRPFLWAQTQLVDSGKARASVTHHHLEYFFCVVCLGVILHLFPVEKNLESGFTLGILTVLLSFVGHRAALPILMFIFCNYLNPTLINFSGFIVFSIFYGGWALRTGLVGLVLLLAIHGEYNEEALFWSACIPLSILMSYLLMSEEAAFEKLKKEWGGVLITISLLSLPFYLEGEAILEKLDPQSPTLIVPPLIFVAAAALFYFWKPKWSWQWKVAKNLWDKTTAWVRATVPVRSTEARPQYKFSNSELVQKISFFEREDFNLSMWLLFVIAGIWGVFLVI